MHGHHALLREGLRFVGHTARETLFLAAAGPLAKFVAVAKGVVSGNPDLRRAGTSHVERKNGTLRQWCKRLTRLTYAFSKKWDNLRAALALHFAHYNFCPRAWVTASHASNGSRDGGSCVRAPELLAIYEHA